MNREEFRKQPFDMGNASLTKNPQFWAKDSKDEYFSKLPDSEEEMNTSPIGGDDSETAEITVNRRKAYETIKQCVDKEFADAVLRVHRMYGASIAGDSNLLSAIDTLIGKKYEKDDMALDRVKDYYKGRMEGRRNGFPKYGIGSWYPNKPLPESTEKPFNGMSVSQMRFLNEFHTDDMEGSPYFDEEDPLPYCKGCMEEVEELRPLSDWAEQFAEEEGWTPEQTEAVDNYIFNAGDKERCETCAMTKFHSIFDEMKLSGGLR